MQTDALRKSTFRRLPLFLLMATLSGGCCFPKQCVPKNIIPPCGTLDRVLYKLSHWQENRCTCEPDSICHHAPVRLGEPTGYLSDGSTLAGTAIAGPRGLEATDVVIGLRERIESLEDDKQRLTGELQQANQTIGSQNERLLAAQHELQLSKEEYDQVHVQMRRWHTALNELDAKYRSSQRRYDSSLAEMEQRLRDMLQSQDNTDTLPPVDPFESMNGN